MRLHNAVRSTINQGTVDLVFDRWRLRHPTTALSASILLLSNNELSVNEKMATVRNILELQPRYFKKRLCEIRNEILVSELRGEVVRIPTIRDMLYEDLEVGSFAAIWNRDTLEDYPILPYKLFLCDLKRSDPMLILNWHKTDLPKPVRNFLQYLTANRSNSPLLLKRISHEERSNARRVYETLAKLFPIFLEQYEAENGTLSQSETMLVTDAIAKLLHNICIVGTRDILVGKVAAVLDSSSTTDREYLRSPEGMESPIAEKVIRAFDIPKIRKNPGSDRSLVSANSNGSYTDFDDVLHKITTIDVVNPAFVSYLECVGNLQYVRTRELLRCINHTFEELIESIPATVQVIGIDSAKICAELNGRSYLVTYKENLPRPEYVFISTCDDLDLERLVNLPSIRSFILIAKRPPVLRGMNAEHIVALTKHILSPSNNLAAFCYRRDGPGVSLPLHSFRKLLN